MKSKLGFHIDVVQYPGQVDRIIQAGTKIVKVISTLEILQRIYAAHGDKVTLIARDWLVGDNFLGFQGHINPKAKAQEWFNKMLPVIQKAPFAYWESFNEMDNWTYLGQYGEFEAERQRIMAEHGYRCCVGNFAVGGPPIVDPNDVWPKFYPALEAAHRYKNILGLHEYGALWMDTYYGPNGLAQLQAGQRVPLPETYAEGWLFGLYRKVWNKHIKPNNWTDLRIAITEMGLMSAAPAEISAIAGYPVGSWRTCGPAWSRLDGRADSEQYYFEQLQWADRQFQSDPYVVGGTIFTWGTFPESAWMQDEIEGPVADKLINYIGSTVDTPRPENKAMHVTGIDLSSHNGAFDFVKAYADGHRFVFLRYSVGAEKDANFDTYLTQARAAGFMVGAYHYMWVSLTGKEQARFFAQADISKLDLPLVVDVEQNITEVELRDMLRELERITGRVPMIYTRKNIIESIVGSTPKDWLKRYRVWLAQYPAVVGEYPTELPIHWSNWEFWQFTSEGQITGHTGNVDINYFNGSLEDLKCRYNYPIFDNFKLRWPVNSPTITQPFGNDPAHYGPLLGAIGMGHEGIDFRAALNDPIYACADGVVAEKSYDDNYGNLIVLDHQNGYKTLYAHLNRPSTLALGARIKAGDRIGDAGTTGASTGTHLHLTVYSDDENCDSVYPKRRNGYIINPTPYLVPPTLAGVVMRNVSGLVLNIRALPDINSADIGDIPVDAVVTAYPPEVNSYIRVQYEGIVGYALARQFAVVADQPVLLRSTAQPYVNVRSGPGTSYTDIGDLPYGQQILGYPVAGQAFWKVIFNGADAWISSQWLEVV